MKERVKRKESESKIRGAQRGKWELEGEMVMMKGGERRKRGYDRSSV